MLKVVKTVPKKLMVFLFTMVVSTGCMCIMSIPAFAAEWIKVDDTSAMVTYDPNWQLVTTTASEWFRKTRHETVGIANRKATFTFTGTKARVYGFKNTTLGKFDIYLDNTYVNTIDCYAASLSYDVLLWESADLSNTQHKVEVVALNQKNASSTSTKVIVDAFSYYGSYQNDNEWKVFDDTGSAITYGSNWTASTETGYYQDTIHSTVGYANATATYNFTGTRVRVLGRRGTDVGIVQIIMDGVNLGNIDCYFAQNLKARIIWESGELPQGNHTLQIIALNTKCASSSSTQVILDSIAYYNDITLSADNKITANPGFENDLTGWGGYSTAAVTTNQHSGSKALGMGYGQCEATRNVSGLKANTPYILSAWVKVGAGGSAKLGIKQYDGVNAPTISAVVTQTQYTHVTVAFNTGANNTYAVVSFYKDSNGANAWADDFTLVEGSSNGGYKLVWNDEFNGADNSAADNTKWRQIEDDHGSNELQFYTNRLTNGWQEHGKMVLKAQPESYNGFNYTSGWIDTVGKKEWTYGRFEVKAKLPYSKGLWPAIWMMPRYSEYGAWPLSGEIDLMELVGHTPQISYANIHNPTGQQSITLPNTEAFADDYHVWTMEWEPGRIRIYVDGALYTDSVRNAPYDKAFYMILNVAVGGDWPGSPNATTVWPQMMYIDYVRVYQKL